MAGLYISKLSHYSGSYDNIFKLAKIQKEVHGSAQGMEAKKLIYANGE